MKKIIFLLVFLCSIYGVDNSNFVSKYTNIKTANITNPAWMLYEYSLDNSSYEIIADNADGKLKQVYTPEKVLDLNYLARGQKKLFESGLFSGYVSFHQQYSDNRKWIHNRVPYQGFPFLFSDSSTGDIKLNGIHMQMGYSHAIISKKLYFGSHVFYNVDEEMKDVFPKPINKHRDIATWFGIGYVVNKKLKFGFSHSYFDFRELMKTSKYSLDQSKTPIFFKVRGLDNPVIFRAETAEEREQLFYGNIYKVDGQITNILINEINFEAGFEKAGVKAEDGGAYPQAQGKMNSDELFYSINMLMPFISGSNLGIFSEGKKNLQKSNHPEIVVEIFKYKKEQILFGSTLYLNLFENLDFNPTFYFSSQFLERIDKFNGILEYFPSQTLGASFESNYTISDKIQVGLAGGMEKFDVKGYKIYMEKVEWYYNEITKFEQEYQKSDKKSMWINTFVKYNINNLNAVKLNVKYNQLSTENHGYYEGFNRNGFYVSFKLMRQL